MKTKILNIIGVMLAVFAFSACGSDDSDGSLQLSGECNIEYIALNGITGVIDKAKRTVVVYLPEVYDTKAMKITALTLSSGAKSDLAVGQVMDMRTSHNMRISNGDVFSNWDISVRNMKDPFAPKAVFIGSAWTKDELDPEARTACQWMLDNVEGAYYAAIEDVRSGTCDLSQCKIIWWHWHVDGGVDGHDKFVERAGEMLAIKNKLQAFYEGGGSFLLSRYATNLAAFIGGTKESCCPNNCWGKDEAEAELCDKPWTFKKFTGQEGHPIYNGLIAGPVANEVYCTDKGYYITNSTAQYHIGSDWGGYADQDTWESETGGKILGVGGDGAVVVWEFPAKGIKGGIICFGSGCFDWYSYKYEDGYVENYHKNIATMTKNAINYLTE